MGEIFSYLELPEWSARRLACPAFYIKSLEPFADRYFKSIHFITTSEGFCQLEEIAKPDIYRVRV